MRINEMKDEEIIKSIKQELAPRIRCHYRLDIQQRPRQVSVEFCGWQTDFLFTDPRVTPKKIAEMIKQAFNNACNPPGFFKRMQFRLKMLKRFLPRIKGN